MDWTELLRIVLEALTGGGLIVTLITLRETRRKAAEEVRQMQTTNAESILQTNEEYIVKPLKREINGLRATVRNLTKVLQKALDCHHASTCPMRGELSKLYDVDAEQPTDDGHCQDIRGSP